MADTEDRILLRIVTPERLVLEEEVDEVVLPAWEGALGVLPEHTPLLARLGVGECDYRKGRAHRYLAVAGGFAEVGPHRVTLLADLAEHPHEIATEELEEEIEAAREALRTATQEEIEVAGARLETALVRQQVAGRHPGESSINTRTNPD